ncbi:shikimate dehydrogenase [Thauera chlorobenzoica]|uniref:Shikimate dehydrogenase (NADP(+)) n=1 Tax=Thauera chlorobenzoica TaxID=96773 RepID=A0A1H5W4S1_9RHOO|nr:shikimate dehydrogenase [Thauera chlorobenzoica]APR03382.1 shikimate 5-dehydrogenase I alpha [Thauera chlorobenzoica]SEF94534.1 shikimate dehydrogenase [Thauera chlorobenzoica]
MDRYAVIGNPIAHSKSPWIHAAFARQTGQALAYEALLGPLDGFTATVHAFRAAGGRGMNVTVPFKLEAYALADRHTPRAEAAGAVNTLVFERSGILGDNTDGAGLVRDLSANLGCTLAGRRILLLGAGGATRGVLLPLLGSRPAALTIANRTVGKARTLAERFTVHAAGTGLDACGFAELAGRRFDLVINATAASLAGELPPLPPGLYAEGALAYDMMYGHGDTRFMQAARADGAAHVADGLGMLVEQAAESFALWRGIRPDSAPVLAALRRQLDAG